MLPTPPQNGRGWFSTPGYDYSFKHTVSWPRGVPPEVGAGAANAGAGASAASEAAAAGASAHFAHPSGPPQGPGMHYHYHGRGGFPGGYRRFGGGRRLVWFGLGIAATAWYFKHQEHKREWHAKALSDSPGPSTKRFWTNGCDNAWGHGWRRSAHEYDAKSSSVPASASPMHMQQQVPPMHASPAPSSSAPSVPGMTSAQDDSAILAALSQDVASKSTDNAPIPPALSRTTASDAEDEKRSWGWGERRRRRVEARRAASEAQDREAQARADEARAIAAASMDQSSASASKSTNTRDGDAEMKRLREVVEALWNDKKMATATAQAQANDRAKEYAREKLDRLSGVLESLRESLKTDAEKKTEKKLV